MALTALALAIASLSNAAWAQSSTPTLPQVVSTASRFEQPQTEALPHTTVITAADIVERQAFDLPTALRGEAGLQLNQSGGPGQNLSYLLRGAAQQESLVLIDGVPARRQGFSAGPALEHIAAEQIDRIEIVRGNVSAIYGSGAIGGVIQIFTKEGAEKAVRNAYVEVGSRNTRQGGLSLSGKTGDTKYSVSASSFQTDGFNLSNPAFYPTDNPGPNGSRNKSFSGALSHEWSKGQELGLRLMGNYGRFSFDNGGFGTATDINTGISDRESFSIFSKNQVTSNWRSTVTLSNIVYRDSILQPTFESRDKNTTELLQWSNEIKLNRDWTVVAGADNGRYKLQAFSAFGGPGTTNQYERHFSSLYAGINGKLGRHQLQFNLRHDNAGAAGSDDTGYLGYGYLLTDKLKLIASLSTAFAAPTLTQLYTAGSGNPNLMSEKSKSQEVGLQYASGPTLLRGTVFSTKTRNQFANDPNCAGFVCPLVNINSSSNDGVELSAASVWRQTDLRASLTLQNPINDATGRLLVRRARTLASLAAGRSYGPLRISADAQYQGSFSDVDGVTFTQTPLHPYWFANLLASYAVNKHWSVYGRVENLFNADHQPAWGINQIPRGVFVGLRWNG